MISFIIEWSTADWINLAFAALVATLGLMILGWLVSAVAAIAVTFFGRREMRKLQKQRGLGATRGFDAQRTSSSQGRRPDSFFS